MLADKNAVMPTICFCNGNIPWGGGENWHLNAALSLAARGWRVLMLCHPEGELYQRARKHEGLACIPLAIGRLAFLNPLLHLKLKRFFADRKVDSLIMNLPADLKAAGPAARAAGVRNIVYRRGSALPVRDSAFNRFLFGRVITRLIANSMATKAQVLKNNPRIIPEEHLSILPNSIDVPGFDAALAAAAPFIHKGQRFTIGNAGRLNRQKGQHMLLHLGKKLLDAGCDVGILIAGAGEREQELKTLAQDLGLGDRVRFTGFMEDLSPFWRSIDLFVLTSLWEGFGSVIIEAMLARKPVFAFAVSNIPELVTEGENGRLFPLPEEEMPNCPDYDGACASQTAPLETGPPSSPLGVMATAIMELAAAPEEAKRMGEAGRAFAEGFSQERCMDRLEELLR